MIDSNYKDVKNNHSTFASIKKTKDNELFKMYGEAVDEDFDYSNDDNITEDGKNLDLIQYNNICKILDPTNFGNSHTNYGGIKPDIKVINLLTKIHSKIKSRADNDKNGNLSDIIINYMGMFVNNRTGTQISTSELENVESQPVNDLIKGQMYAYRIRDQLFVWVIYLNNVDEDNCNVLTRNNYKDTDEIIEKKINRMELFEYSSLTNPEQKYKPQEAKLSEDELLEIYYVN
jgi:hypothetical protein